MNDIAADSKLDDLERRVQALETKVSTLPDAKQIDEQIQANLPPPAPSFKDIALPIPNVDTLVTTARTTWAIFEMFADIKAMLWMLVDRRYHMGWITRLLTIVLVVAIFLSPWWAPFAGYDNFISRIVDKAIDLVLGLVLFTVLFFETRRYKEWRKGRS